MDSKSLTIRVTPALRHALEEQAKREGLSLSRLGRIALRMFIRNPPQDLDWLLLQAAKAFRGKPIQNVTITLSQDEFDSLSELAQKYRRGEFTPLVTAALANVLTESSDTIVEEAYVLKSQDARERAGMIGLIKPVQSPPAETPVANPNPNPTTQSSEICPDGVHCPDGKDDPPAQEGWRLQDATVVGGIGAVAASLPIAWTVLHWNDVKRGLENLWGWLTGQALGAPPPPISIEEARMRAGVPVYVRRGIAVERA